MLSKLERGEKNPTLVVAARIAQGLESSLTSLLGVDEQRRRIVLVPRDRQPAFRDPETGFERHVLSPPFEGRTVELLRHVIPEGASSGDLPPYRTGVEKYLVVERGRLEVTVGDQAYRLVAGDALYFEADIPHRFSNAGRGACRYLLVVSLGRT
jgi:quercetin dioxygenase-like cupin family protein